MKELQKILWNNKKAMQTGTTIPQCPNNRSENRSWHQNISKYKNVKMEGNS